MKKKIILMLVTVFAIALMLAITASADSLSNFINVDLTLTDGSQTVGYLKKSSTTWDYPGYDRITIYADYTDTSKIISWSTVEVFDGRNSEICTYDGTTLTKTGTYAQTLLGHISSSDASSLKRVYYPQGALAVASSSYQNAKGYTSLEYVWIPNTVELIGANAFQDNTSLLTVELEEGSQLKKIDEAAFWGCTGLVNQNLSDAPLVTIGKNSFRGMSQLAGFDFPETLETVGYCAFFESGLAGKVVLPNSVTSVGDGAFRSTKIEVFSIGDGPVNLGFNIVGNDNDTYLKEIYIPIEAAFVNQPNSAWFASSLGPITFYVIAKEGEDTSAFVETLRGTGRVTFVTQEEIDAGTATSGYSAVIVTGYNKCDAFYNGAHKEVDDSICTTDNPCEICNKVLKEKLANHTLLNTIKYPNGFDKTGVGGTICTNENCTYVDGNATAPGAIFGASGYSMSFSGNGMSGGFSFNVDAYNDYVNATQNALRFGIIAVNANSFEQGSELLDEHGILNSTLGLQVEMTTTEYSKFSCQIDNFSESAKTNLELIFVLYIIDSNGNVHYVQSDSDYVKSATIGARTFDKVTLALVIANTPQKTDALPANEDDE